MIFVLVAIEIGICGIWEFLLTPPDVTINNRNNQRIVACTSGGKLLGFVIWTMYNSGEINRFYFL